MLRRTALARAMMLEPQILLCDEPFAGLDPTSSGRIETLARARSTGSYGITVLIVSHHIASTMRLASQTLLLLADRTVCGPPDELRPASIPTSPRSSTRASRLWTGASVPARRRRRFVLTAVRHLGWQSLHVVSIFGRVALFGGRIVRATVLPPYRPRRFLEETYYLGASCRS